jgi:hypothetical protein
LPVWAVALAGQVGHHLVMSLLATPLSGTAMFLIPGLLLVGLLRGAMLVRRRRRDSAPLRDAEQYAQRQDRPWL